MKKQNQDHSHRKLKAQGIPNGIPIRKPIHAEEPRCKKIPGKDKRRPVNGKVVEMPKEAMLMIAKDRAAGQSIASLAIKYGLSQSYIDDSLRTLFVTSKVGREILKNVLLDNAIASGMRVRETINDLNPMQAVVATGIMTQRFVEMDKHIQSAPQEVDFASLVEMGNLLKDINASVKETDVDTSDVIDVS